MIINTRLFLDGLNWINLNAFFKKVEKVYAIVF
jgi:hypothetical protein